MTPDQIVQLLTPVLVPLLIAAVKHVLPSLPRWTPVVLAPILGALVGVVQGFASTGSQNLWISAGLGLLGIAVREVKDAIAPAANGGWPVVPPKP